MSKIINFELNNSKGLKSPTHTRRDWMCGHTRRDWIRNEDIQNKVGVTSMKDKMRK